MVMYIFCKEIIQLEGTNENIHVEFKYVSFKSHIQ